MSSLAAQEYFALSRALEQHHTLFYIMWELGYPAFVDNISTARVIFNKEEGGKIRFEFGTEYWDSLDDYTRCFVISHECLHVALNHGVRICDSTKATQHADMALDVVVNHMLVNKFGFERKRIIGGDKFCWVDTIFPNQELPEDEAFEYYFNKFEKCPESIVTVDIHGAGGEGDGEACEGTEGFSDFDFDGIIDELNDRVPTEDKGTLKKEFEKHAEVGAGNSPGGQWDFADIRKIVRKKKWETVIQKWSRQFIKADFRDVEQWTHPDRRFQFLSGDLILPSDIERLYEAEDRIEVWFFQDTSASCKSLRNRFFAAAESLDPKRFDIKMHCFDTRVYETTLVSRKLYGFGGTDFVPIETYIQAHMLRENCPYPAAVFVVTDGYGGATVQPQMPRKWYWFLTNNYTRCIPDESHVFKLKDYQ